MSLISRKAVRDGMMKYGFIAPDMTVHEFVEDELPSVPAVPLDKLCEFLGGAVTPCILLNIGCPYNEATRKDCDSCIAREAWKITLSKWMEEQDADRQ